MFLLMNFQFIHSNIPEAAEL